MSESKTPSGIDRLVGQRLRWRRRELRLTQEKLGDLLNLTFQQVQKYEKGVNRISAGRLYEVAAALGVPIGYFYDGASEFLSDTSLRISEDRGSNAVPVLSPEAVELVSAFETITDPAMRKTLLETVTNTAAALNRNKLGAQ
ncbi:MAG: helix-turn-helix transcriptional regulator [Hyphomonadaceae bacterium]